LVLSAGALIFVESNPADLSVSIVVVVMVPEGFSEGPTFFTAYKSNSNYGS
jgi:hypothetical protein